MALNKERLLKAIDSFDEEIPEEVKAHLFDVVKTEQDAANFLKSSEEFNSLPPQSQEWLLKDIAIPDKPKPVDYTLGVAGDMIDKVGGSLLNSASGLAKGLMENVADPMVRFPLWASGNKQGLEQLNQVEQGISEKVIDPVKEYGQKLQATSQQWEQENLGATGRFVSDVADLTIKAAPFLLAASTANPLAMEQAVAFGLDAMGSKYNQARDKGFTPTEAGLRAAGSGVLQGAAEKLFIGDAYKLGKIGMKKLTQNVLRGFKTGAGLATGEHVLDATADIIVNDIFQQKDTGRLRGDETFGETVQNILRTGLIGAGHSGLMEGGGKLAQRLDLWSKGQKLAYIEGNKPNEGQHVVVDTYIPQEKIESLGQVAKSLSKDNGLPVGHNFEVLYSGLKNQVYTNDLVNTANVEASLNKPLKNIFNEVENIPSPETIAPPTSTDVGAEVGVMPMANPRFQVEFGATLNQPLKGKIVGNSKEGFFDVAFEGKEGGTIISDIPERFVVDHAETIKRLDENAPLLESSTLINYIGDIITEGKDISKMSPGQQHLAMGGMFDVVQKIRGGAYGNFNAKRGRIKIIHDALVQHPEMAPRILSHEIGHFLVNGSGELLSKLGIDKFKGFGEFINREVKSYKDDLKIIQDNWNIYPTSNEKMSANEQMADAVSAFLNKPKVRTNDPITQTKLYSDFISWVESQPKLSNAWNNLVNLSENTIKSKLDEQLLKKFDEADVVLGQKAQRDRDKTTMSRRDLYSSIFIKEAQPLFNEINRATNKTKAEKLDMINAIDAFKLSHETSIAYMKANEDTLVNLGVSPSDVKLFMFYNRIVTGGREKVLTIKEHVNEFALMQEAIADLQKNGDYTSEEATKIVKQGIKDFEPQIIEVAKQLLNPEGVTKEQASKALVDMDGRFGTEYIDKLKEFTVQRHENMKEWVLPELIKSSQYTSKELDMIANNENYATFNVVKHALIEKLKTSGGISEGRAPGLFTQEGTLSSIENPLTATLGKDISMAEAARAKMIVRDTLKFLVSSESPFVKELAPSDKGYTYQGKDKEIVTTYEVTEGDEVVKRHYLVDSLLMKTFKHTEVEPGVSRFSDLTNMFKQGWTLYNPTFWVNNLIRDTTRSFFNAPGRFDQRLKTALIDVPIMASRQVKDNYYGLVSDLRKHLTKLDVLSGGTYGTKSRKEQTTERLNRMDTKSKAEVESRGVARKLFEGYKGMLEGIGDAMEYSNKAAWYNHIKRLNKGEELNPRQLQMLRNEIGSPIFAHKGSFKLMQNLYMFINPAIQGYTADYQNYKNNKGAFLMKRLSTLALYNMGLYWLRHFDEDGKQALMGLTDRDWSSKFVIPLGITTDGVGALITAPMDEVTQIFQALMVNTLFRPMMEEQHMTIGQGIKTGVANILSSVPTTNPLIGVPLKGIELASTGNVTDSFTGRPVMPKDVAQSSWKEHGGTKAAYLAKYLYDSTGALPSLFKFSFSSQDPQFARSENSQRRKILDAMGMTKNFMSIGRYIRFTNYGNTEIRNRMADEVATQRSDAHLYIKDAMSMISQKIAAGQETLTQDEIKLIVNSATKDKRYFKLKLGQLLKTIKIQTQLKNYDSSYLLSLMQTVSKAKSKPEREAAAKIVAETYNRHVVK